MDGVLVSDIAPPKLGCRLLVTGKFVDFWRKRAVSGLGIWGVWCRMGGLRNMGAACEEVTGGENW